MKIVRFLTKQKKVRWGVVESMAAQTARLIKGNLWQSFEVTQKEEPITKLLSPFDPVNIFAIGLNYKKHADETGVSYPEVPVMFIKATNSVIGPGESIILPQAGPDEVDCEAELAIVIKKAGKNIPPEKVMNYILGFTCANDVSARDWQIRYQKKQWARGKSFDTFCPFGPCIVTVDEIGDPNNLAIRSKINGRVLQNSSTADMIFSVSEIVSNLSQSITLLPGTLILTGTPNGV